LSGSLRTRTNVCSGLVFKGSNGLALAATVSFVKRGSKPSAVVETILRRGRELDGLRGNPQSFMWREPSVRL
jgi:hypothetical protein